MRHSKSVCCQNSIVFFHHHQCDGNPRSAIGLHWKWLVIKVKKQNFCFWEVLRKRYWVESSTFSVGLRKTFIGLVPLQPCLITTNLLSLMHKCRSTSIFFIKYSSVLFYFVAKYNHLFKDSIQLSWNNCDLLHSNYSMVEISCTKTFSNFFLLCTKKQIVLQLPW